MALAQLVRTDGEDLCTICIKKMKREKGFAKTTVFFQIICLTL